MPSPLPAGPFWRDAMDVGPYVGGWEWGLGTGPGNPKGQLTITRTADVPGVLRGQGVSAMAGTGGPTPAAVAGRAVLGLAGSGVP